MSVSPLPAVGTEKLVAEVKTELDDRATTTPDSFSIHGPRSDLSEGRGPRYRHGILPEGFYGVEIFTADGKRNRNGKWASEIFFFSGATAPEGCEEADGATVDPTTSDQKYLYLARGMGVSETATFAKPNARGRVLVGKATSGTFVTLRATGGAETASDGVSVSGTSGAESSHTHAAGSYSVLVPSHNIPDSGNTTWPTGNSGSIAVSGTSAAGSSHTHSISGSDTVVVSTLQPYLILLGCVAL